MKAIKDYLQLSGMTQVELARRAGMSAITLNHFIAGRREPKIKNLRKLSLATGISFENLLKGL